MSYRAIQVAFLVTVASILFTLESLIPSPIPWIRLGLANVVTLLALKWWGMKEALIVLIMRVILGSLLSGKFLSPVFLIAISGGIASTLVMGMGLRLGERILSLIGISIMGAVAKNVIQILVTYFIYIRQVYILYLFPIFLFSSLITGTLIGIFAHLIHQKVNLSFSPQKNNFQIPSDLV